MRGALPERALLKQWWWIPWVVIVFGLMCPFGPSLEIYRSQNAAAGASSTQLSPSEVLLLELRDDWDVRRYFAYANAILGRPYDAQYVVLTKPSAAGVAHGPLVPWRDFAVEYPPGMIVTVLLPALFTDDFDTFDLLFFVEMGLCLTAAVFFGVRASEELWPGSSARVLATTTLMVLALGVVAVRRYDPVVALANSLLFLGLVRSRPSVAGLALAAGIAAKGVPLLLVPPIAILFASQGRWRDGTRAGWWTLAGIAGVAGGYFWLTALRGLDAFAYQGERPIEVESLVGSLLMVARLVNPALAHSEYSFGSYVVATATEPALRLAVSVVTVAALLAVFGWGWTRAKVEGSTADRFHLFAVTSSCALAALMLCGKVFSPQYLVWLIPLGTIATARSSLACRAALLLACLLTQVEYPFLFPATAYAMAPRLGAILVLRDVLLLAWMVMLMREAISPDTSRGNQSRAVGAPVASPRSPPENPKSRRVVIPSRRSTG